MEINGSWLVPTDEAAGLDFGIAPIPKGPAGRFTSVNPTGVVVYKSTKSPDAAWEFVKYLASPAAQEQLMQLRAALPVSKEVLAGPYAASFEGAKVFADSLAYAKPKPSFAGLRGVRRRPPGRAGRERVHGAQQDRTGRARGRRAQARCPAGRSVTRGGDTLTRARAAHRDSARLGRPGRTAPPWRTPGPR